MRIKRIHKDATIPTKGSDGAAGYDLYSTEDYKLCVGERKLFKTGLQIEIPSGLYGRIAPRSGLAYKHGIDVLAGVIDSDYRGDIGVILINFGNEAFEVKTRDRIAQLIFESYDDTIFMEEGKLSESDRGEGGYGSTGTK
jgi:dUTP pyrophosphatase